MDPCYKYQEECNSHLRRCVGIGRTMVGWAVMGALLNVAPTRAAEWLAPAADQAVTAAWVTDITTQLNQEPYRQVFLSAPGFSPQAAIVRYLNSAAAAVQARKTALAQSYVDRVIGLFDAGVQRGYFAPGEVEPIKNLIRSHAASAIKGEHTETDTKAGVRWTGYTHQESLGLAEGPSRSVREHPKTQ